MPDTYRPIPPENTRGRDLCEWHVVECECRSCGHMRVVPHGVMQERKRGELTIAEMHFRCLWCGERGPHEITVYALPRNW
jgi:uncharacterized Zn finger protein